MNEVEKVKEAVNFLKHKKFFDINVAIILGTGLGDLLKKIDIEQSIEYKDIPHFAIATAETHKGILHLGKIKNKKVLVMQGRYHYYEGHSMNEIVFPIRVFNELGIKFLIISNAAGNMNLYWNKGEIMLIDDHINLLPDNPIRNKDAREFGNIFVDLVSPYSQELNNKLLKIAKENNIKLNKGVYVAVMGPHLETRAEYRYLRNMGADAVGMSTVPEVIAANQLNLPVCAISVLTDQCDPDNLQPIDIDDIFANVKKAEQKLVVLIEKLFETL